MQQVYENYGFSDIYSERLKTMPCPKSIAAFVETGLILFAIRKSSCSFDGAFLKESGKLNLISNLTHGSQHAPRPHFKTYKPPYQP